MQADIITLIESYCASTGRSPTTVCLQAVNNSRLHARLIKRRAHDAETEKRLRSWIAAQPDASEVVIAMAGVNQPDPHSLSHEAKQ